MRHLYDKAHLGRSRSHRRALLSNMSASLFLHRRVVTTLGKAKFARRFAERLITFARKGDLAARRIVASRLGNPAAVKILFDQLGPHFKTREGGYTRIIKLGVRPGDAAPVCLLELVGFDDIAPVASTGKGKSAGKSRLKEAQKAAGESKKSGKKAKSGTPAPEPESASSEG
ncbi:MAG: 50S ribosomal protein L17 [Calditrichaeota bacterium]|nr:50S ribosomal protein L17 [Calditrichota bacterium]